MSLSSYPAGFKGGALLNEVPLFTSAPGNVFWVDSQTGGTGNPGTFNRPLSTVAGAISKCTAGKGDVVICKPGHTETFTTAGALALSVSGVTVTGGSATGALRPTFVMDNTAATITVTGANVSIHNVIFKSSVGDLVTILALGAGSTDFTLDRCAFYDDAAADNFVDAITTTTTANAHDGLTVRRCEVVSDDTGNQSFVQLNGTLDRFVFEDNVVYMGVADNQRVIEQATGKVMTACSIQRNSIHRDNIASTAETGDIFVGNDGTTNSGTIANNFVGHLDPLAESIINVTGTTCFNNYSCGVADKSGYLLPAADS